MDHDSVDPLVEITSLKSTLEVNVENAKSLKISRPRRARCLARSLSAATKGRELTGTNLPAPGSPDVFEFTPLTLTRTL